MSALLTPSQTENACPTVPEPAVTTSLASGKNRGTENFPVGSLLIRPDLRAHVHAFYNFARAADDVSDHPLMAPQDKIRLLDRFAMALKFAPTDMPPSKDPEEQRLDQIAHTMRESLIATAITPQHCHDLLTAFKRDVTQLRYRDWDDLLDYCRYSASPVGRYVLALHGIGERAWAANDALCSILQVINHIQDCVDDYGELDRVYIPQDMLNAQGGMTTDLTRSKSTLALRATLDAMLDKLDLMMPTARDLPRQVPDIRLKCETAIIYTLAEKLIMILRQRDPLYAHVKLDNLQVILAAAHGLVRAWA